MPDREKVIEGLQDAAAYFRSSFDAMYGTIACETFRNWTDAIEQALALLKAQEPATVEPKRIELANETKEWLDEMDAIDALGNIADICIDWDGYRTADGLGGLINEIWAYARYCADRLLKAQEPRVMTLEEVKAAAGHDVWLELSGNIADDVLFATTIEGCGTKGWCTRYESFNYSAYGIRPYGWRCWTSRPTDEQREAIPWN